MARQIPQTLTSADTFKVYFDAHPYSTADNFGLTLYLIGPSGTPQKTTHVANANASSATVFDLRIAPAVSANLAAGLYAYSVVASDNTDSYTVESGNLTVLARADNSLSSDLRTHTQKVYDAICAVIEGRATSDVGSYSIAGRTLTKIPLADLLKIKEHYKELLKTEQGNKQKKVLIRFNQA